VWWGIKPRIKVGHEAIVIRSVLEIAYRAMAEIARHVGVCASAVVKSIQKMESRSQES
jgi:DNA-binding MurR/RpiR family transcriptional regulator